MDPTEVQFYSGQASAVGMRCAVRGGAFSGVFGVGQTRGREVARILSIASSRIRGRAEFGRAPAGVLVVRTSLSCSSGAHLQLLAGDLPPLSRPSRTDPRLAEASLADVSLVVIGRWLTDSRVPDVVGTHQMHWRCDRTWPIRARLAPDPSSLSDFDAAHTSPASRTGLTTRCGDPAFAPPVPLLLAMRPARHASCRSLSPVGVV